MYGLKICLRTCGSLCKASTELSKHRLLVLPLQHFHLATLPNSGTTKEILAQGGGFENLPLWVETP